MRQYIAAVWVAGLLNLAGCVSQPTEVKAQVPLVNASQFTSLVSTQSSNLKGQAKAIPELEITIGKSKLVEGQRYYIADQYISALGLTCYKLTAERKDLPPESRAVCQKDSYWILYPATITHNSF